MNDSEKIQAIRDLIASWPKGDNGQDYRRGVNQAAAAVMAVVDADDGPS